MIKRKDAVIVKLKRKKYFNFCNVSKIEMLFVFEFIIIRLVLIKLKKNQKNQISKISLTRLRTNR